MARWLGGSLKYLELQDWDAVSAGIWWDSLAWKGNWPRGVGAEPGLTPRATCCALGSH